MTTSLPAPVPVSNGSFGPLKIVATNAELYFFKELPPASR